LLVELDEVMLVVELGLVTLVEAVTEVIVGVMETAVVVELGLEELVADVDAALVAEYPYSTTLASTQSATHRLPLESNASPVGWSSPVGVGLMG
jgi:hypothetical protein